MEERIQKIIASAGITSRRAAEQLITEGRVRVNGVAVTELGTKADPARDHIKVDGKLINPRQPQTYIMLNKPAGYVTTLSDPEGRPTVQDLLKGIKVRVYPVGRLDYNTEGMLLLTNDGDFAHLITHPKHELPKTYLVKVKGVLDDRQIEDLETGIFLDDGKTAPAKIKKVRKEEANSWVEITIHEGRKRQVRRMFDRIGRSVIRLKRIRTGGLMLGDLPEGRLRHLTTDEVTQLREMAQKQPGGGPAVAATPAPRIKTREGGIKISGRNKVRTVESIDARVMKKAHKGRLPELRPWKMEDRGKGASSSTREQHPQSASRGRGRFKPAHGRPAGASDRSGQWRQRSGAGPAAQRPESAGPRMRPAGTADRPRGAGQGARPWRAGERDTTAAPASASKVQQTAPRRSRTPQADSFARPGRSRVPFGERRPGSGGRTFKPGLAGAAGRPRPSRPEGKQLRDMKRGPAGSGRPAPGRPGSGGRKPSGGRPGSRGRF